MRPHGPSLFGCLRSVHAHRLDRRPLSEASSLSEACPSLKGLISTLAANAPEASRGVIDRVGLVTMMGRYRAHPHTIATRGSRARAPPNENAIERGVRDDDAAPASALAVVRSAGVRRWLLTRWGESRWGSGRAVSNPVSVALRAFRTAPRGVFALVYKAA